MSVLIKGMEMPESCAKCPLEQCEENYYGDIMNRECCLIYKGYTSGYSNKRREDCPIFEVPPHGRLIDADALCERIERQRNTEYAMKNRPHGTWERVLNLPLDMISDAPTIIPAEEDET